MYGKKQKAPRWKDCTSNTMHRMQYAVGAMYVRKAFDQVLPSAPLAYLHGFNLSIQASKNVTLEMIDDLQQEFREMVLNNDWMDAKTKATALDKAKQMLRQIAYPDFILDDDKLDDHYSGVGDIP
ncbi:hypothetical protein ANCDUO_01481 [Ancylostoma duodenale]|uniref:Peptidase M13 N-terminal domain-containing protein n=1 Tax=Ancylostoma duodenale TaxID=51022 RepID=A0A0C2HF46_9BILA|nr:hypothetical protein ANCDUO_01481 [Ancylostoma duodenale]